jgi:hypothetical protein
MATDRMIIWSGTSALDGVTPIILLATGVPRGGKAVSSQNSKTGNMIQTVILRDDMSPVVALKNGDDEAICGVCPHRGKASGGSGACYVNVGQGPRSTWVAHQSKGSVPFDLARFEGQKVRFGTYGDPAAVPFEVWEEIAGVAAGVTGYTHQWRTADQRFSRFCMASADSADEGREARKLGYRNFIVRAAGTAAPKGALVCPASEEAGKKTVCASCMACGGTDVKNTRDITIQAHGATKRAFAALPLTVV